MPFPSAAVVVSTGGCGVPRVCGSLGVQEAREVDPFVSGVGGAASLNEALSWVVVEVLRHHYVRVETDLMAISSTSFVVGTSKERSTDALALGRWVNGDVVYVEVVRLSPHHDEANEPSIESSQVHDPV